MHIAIWAGPTKCRAWRCSSDSAYNISSYRVRLNISTLCRPSLDDLWLTCKFNQWEPYITISFQLSVVHRKRTVSGVCDTLVRYWKNITWATDLFNTFCWGYMNAEHGIFCIDPMTWGSPSFEKRNTLLLSLWSIALILSIILNMLITG